MTQKIELAGVRVHNLKGIDLEIPHGQLVSICGVSGSGKSSLAFDTLYAESQRRYFESLSTGSRRFLEQLERPDADRIDGLPPAIAVRASRESRGMRNGMATVGSASGIADHLRLLFSKVASPVCPKCRLVIQQHSPESVLEWIGKLPPGRKFQITFEIVMQDSKQASKGTLLELQHSGFRRVVVNGKSWRLDDPGIPASSQLLVIVDRLTSDSYRPERVMESLETAFESGHSQISLLVQVEPDKPDHGPIEIDSQSWSVRKFGRIPNCPQCGRTVSPPHVQLFNPASPLGACDSCHGTGTATVQEVLSSVCQTCDGSGLYADALCYRIGNQNYAEVNNMQIDQAKHWFSRSDLVSSEIAKPVLSRIVNRLEWLEQVGLGYLQMNRKISSISNGETQRVMLTGVLGSTLTNMLYVLDEPSSGLHVADIPALSRAVRNLNRRGNTVVVVDHKREMILNSDRVLEIGPGAGTDGGEIVFDVSPETLLQTGTGITGEYLTYQRGLRSPETPRRKGRGRLVLEGACGNNLKQVTVSFPLECLCVVTGLSGAGKSSLVQQTLFPALKNLEKSGSHLPGLPFSRLSGTDRLDETILVDALPVGKTSRSNPVSYIKAFDDIRRLFADTADAKAAGFKAGHFSFNVDGGRCTKCKGSGQLAIDMEFMSDIVVKCDRCDGKRFRREILAIRYRARNIHEVLEMTVREAFTFFRGQSRIQKKLKALIDTGLDYMRLGQPVSTLSSGEAQRLKLAHCLGAPGKRRTLILLEEPTFGLHMRDIVRLVDCFDMLVAAGHSLIVVEHNLQLVKHADWIIDLGPGSASDGGTVVATGTPEQVASVESSATGRCLRELFAKETQSLKDLGDSRQG